MGPVFVLLFAFFGGASGVAFDIPAIYRANDNAAVDLGEILADIPVSTGNLEELVEGVNTLGEITGALNFDAVEGIDFSNPITIPDTLPFPFEPSTPGLPPPALGGAAQDIFTNLVPNVQGPPEDVVANFPEEFQGFGEQFARFAGGNFGFRKGSFETDQEETLQVNVLDDILSQN